MVQPFGGSGKWTVYGSESHDSRIVPEDLHIISRLPGGADTAIFTLSRSLGVTWPDLFPFDPIEVYIGGQKVFKGRIRETPSASDDKHTITVVAEGLRYTLLDTVINRAWVRADLSEWRDNRTYPNCDIGTGTQTQAGVVQAAKNGSIVLTFTPGATIQTLGAVGIMLDQGPWPDNYVARMEVDMVSGWASGNWQTFIRSGDVDGNTGNVSPTQNADVSPARNVTTVAGTQGYTFLADTDGAARSRRYVGVYLRNTSASGIVNADTHWTRITAIRLYYKAAYASANASILKASDVVVDVVNAMQNTGLLTASLTTATPAGKVAPSTYVFPQFNTGGYKTLADVIDAANGMDGNDWLIDENGALVFKAARVPGTNPPDWVCRLSTGARLSLAGASGQDMYTGVIVRGADGAGILVERLRRNGTQTSVLGGTPYVSDSKCPVATNPGLEVNTVGWTADTNTTMSRDVTQFHTGAASLKIVTVAAGKAGCFYSGWASNFIQGESYTFSAWVRQGSVSGSITLTAYSHNGTNTLSSGDVGPLVAGWQLCSWTFVSDFTGPVKLGFSMAGGGAAATMFWLDDGPVITRNAFGILGARGVLRTAVLDISNTLSDADAYNIGNAYLAAQTGYPPFRGTLTVGGGNRSSPYSGGVRDARSNEPAQPWQLKVGQLIQVADIPDPARGGALGRSAKIVAIDYDHTTRVAQLELDNSRDWVYTLESRLRGIVI